MPGQGLRTAHDPVGTGDALRGRVPDHDVLVPWVVVVQVAAAPGALADLAEGQLAQAAQLQQQRGTGGAGGQQDLLAIGGLAQLGRCGNAGGDPRRRHRRRQRLGTGERSGRVGRAVAAQRVQRTAHGQQLRARVTALAQLHRLADAQPQRAATTGEHLTCQQRGTGRLEQGRGAVEQRRVARLHPHRQHRCPGGAGKADEPALPAAIADAAQRQARDLAGREHDHALLGGQRLLHRMQAAALRLAAENAHRQQQILQRCDRPQQVIGHDPHVAAYTADRVQQRQRIQGSGRVIGDDQQAAGGRNPGQRGRIHLVLATDEFQAGGDEAEAAQSRTALQEGFDLVQPRPAADAAATAAPVGRDGRGTSRGNVAGGAVRVPAWRIHGCPAAGLADSLRPPGGSQMAVSGQNDDARPTLPTDPRPARPAPAAPPRCHAGGTLGPAPGAQSRWDRPCRPTRA